MAKTRITPQEMRRVTEVVERRMFGQFLAAMTAVRADLTLTAITELINANQLNQAVEAATAAMSNWFNTNWIPAYNTSATDAALFLQRSLGIPMTFDVTNFSAVGSMQSHRVRLVTGFGMEQRDATMRALQNAFTTGANPRDTARAIRGSIGLTENQTRAVQNYRRLLQENNSEALTRGLRDRRFDSTVRQAIRNKEPLSKTQIDRMVGRYDERMLKFRSEVIARTESLRSVNGGQKDMFDQAVASGDLQNDQLERTWNTAKDERVRDSHSAMHNQTVSGVVDPFISGLSNALQYPGDPAAPAEDTVQCRCAVGTRITKIVVPA